MIFLIPLGNSFNNRGQIEGDEFYSRRMIGQEGQEDQEDQGDHPEAFDLLGSGAIADLL
jgi:hypothetical protein